MEDKFSLLFFALLFNEEMLSRSCKVVVCRLRAAASTVLDLEHSTHCLSHNRNSLSSVAADWS